MAVSSKKELLIKLGELFSSYGAFAQHFSKSDFGKKSYLNVIGENNVNFWMELYPSKKQLYFDHSTLFTKFFTNKQWSVFIKSTFASYIKDFEVTGLKFVKQTSVSEDTPVKYKCFLKSGGFCTLGLFDCTNKVNRGISLCFDNIDFNDEKILKESCKEMAFLLVTIRNIIDNLDTKDDLYGVVHASGFSARKKKALSNLVTVLKLFSLKRKNR